MEAASGRRRYAFIAALALVLAAAALWASFALAGGSGSSAKAPAKKPVAGQVADTSKAAKPMAKRHGDDGQCPFRGDQASADQASL
jgi:hypothetical protein